MVVIKIFFLLNQKSSESSYIFKDKVEEWKAPNPTIAKLKSKSDSSINHDVSKILEENNHWESNYFEEQYVEVEFFELVDIAGIRIKVPYKSNTTVQPFNKYKLQFSNANVTYPNWSDKETIVRQGYGMDQKCCYWQTLHFAFTRAKIVRLYMYTSHYPEGAVYPEKDGKIAIQELEFKFLTGL